MHSLSPCGGFRGLHFVDHNQTGEFKVINNNLSRDQAIEIVGLDAVESAEATNAVQTGTLRRDGQVEFKSRFVCKDKNGDKCTVSAIWLMDVDDVRLVDDLSDLYWDDCNHYIVD
jgi:hypothetical protein